MALNLPFLGRNDPAPLPTEQLTGTQGEAPDPGDVKPRVGGPPLGASGRANFYGLPQSDELNPKLTGPQGLRVLDDMYRTDAHVRRLVLAAWAPIVAGTWGLEPYGADDATDRDRQVADQIWWMLTEFMCPTFTEHLASLGPLLLRSGFTPYEQLWATCKHPQTGKTLLAPRKLDVRLPRSVWRWWQDDYGELTHIGQILPNKPDTVIPASEIVYYRLGAEGDNWQGMSLLRHAYKNWFLKDKLERIDAIGQERKAVGVPIVYPPENADPQTKAEFEQILANLHVSEVAYIMAPGPKAGITKQETGKEWFVEIVQFDSSSGDSIKESITYHETAIASSFLTDFLELGHHQVGARATAQVQEDPFLTAINGALLPPVIPPLNRLIDRIRKLNFDGVDGSPTLKLTLHDEASLSEIATYVQQLATAEAIQLDPELEDYLRQRASFPSANPDIRDQRLAAQKQAYENAAKPPDEQPPGGEPPNPDRPQNAKPAEKPPPPPAKDARSKDGEGKKTLDDAPPPPSLRVADRPPECCATCKMFDPDLAGGACWGYGNFPVKPQWVCDSWTQGEGDDDAEPDGDEPDDDDTITLDQPTPTGTMVALYPHPADASQLAIDGGEDPDALHVTLAFTGAADAMPDAPKLHRAVSDFAADESPVTAKLSGAGVFHGAETPVTYHSIDAPQLPSMRERLVDHLERNGIPVSKEHGFTPHMTVAYADRRRDADPPQGKLLHFGHVSSVVAGDRRDHSLAGKRTLDAPAPEPTAKWWERLLSQYRLREALDGARQHVETAAHPQAVTGARRLADQARNGATLPDQPPPELVDALTAHYQDLYQLGHQTVQDELAKQRAALGKQLDARDVFEGIGARFARARQRGEHSARSIVSAVNARLRRDQVTGLKDGAALQQTAEQVATGQLHVEALANASSSIVDGRADAASADPQVVGGYLTSVLDGRTCDVCAASDNDVLLPPDEAALAAPNPLCEGGDYCRCQVVWVLSDDPAALDAVVGEEVPSGE